MRRQDLPKNKPKKNVWKRKRKQKRLLQL